MRNKEIDMSGALCSQDLSLFHRQPLIANC